MRLASTSWHKPSTASPPQSNLMTSPMSDDKTLRFGRKPPTISRDIGIIDQLPPQALEMEEAVLGAAILQPYSLEKVSKIIRADHFYKETHKEVWLAIEQLISAGDPVDMRSVRNQLRKTGKLEAIGGGYVVAELTSKVSSSENIEYHARVIIEMAIKRDLIQFAYKVTAEAYGNETDALKFLQASIEELQAISADVTKSSGPERIKELWKDTLVTIEPPVQQPLLMINDSIIATRGNHSLLVGKKKSRKTLYIVYLVAKYLLDNPDRNNSVLLFDTEQGRHHVYRLRQKIHLLTGLYVPVFYLRGMAPKVRRDFIAETIKHWECPPDLIIIDGIRDLMSNINDPDETTEVITWLEKITLEHNVHVIDVLHLNKTDGNARGHIGSELLNKAEVTTELERDEKSGVTIVKCESSREKPFENFAFTHGANDLPELVGVPIQGNAIPMDEELKRVHAAWEEGSLKYNDALDAIKNHFAVGNNRAGQMLAKFQRNGWVIKSGPSRDPSTVYKLMVTNHGGTLKELPKQEKLEFKAGIEEINDLPF